MGAEIPRWVALYIGLPFRDRGRTRAGLDCWGLMRLVFREQTGKDLPDIPYRSTADARNIGQWIEDAAPQWREVAGYESVMDIALFAANPLHVGMVVGDGQILHIEEDTCSVVESYRSSRWGNRLLGVYRYVG